MPRPKGSKQYQARAILPYLDEIPRTVNGITTKLKSEGFPQIHWYTVTRMIKELLAAGMIEEVDYEGEVSLYRRKVDLEGCE